MLKTIITSMLCVFLAGCPSLLPAKIETVQVYVPVPTKRVCPTELCEPIVYGPRPVFLTDPAHPDRVYLDEEGQKRLRDLMAADNGRLKAFMGYEAAP